MEAVPDLLPAIVSEHICTASGGVPAVEEPQAKNAVEKAAVEKCWVDSCHHPYLRPGGETEAIAADGNMVTESSRAVPQEEANGHDGQAGNVETEDDSKKVESVEHDESKKMYRAGTLHLHHTWYCRSCHTLYRSNTALPCHALRVH